MREWGIEELRDAMSSFPRFLIPQFPHLEVAVALSIDSVTITPHPLPASGGLARATCRVTSDAPVKSVMAYPPMGDPVTMVPDTNGQYTAIEYVPPGSMPGAYEVTLVATDETGETARKSVMVTLE